MRKIKRSDRTLLIIIAVVVAITAIACVFMERKVNLYSNTLQNDDVTLTNLANDLQVRQAGWTAGTSVAVNELNGIDSERVSADTEVFTTFMHRVLDWQGITNYNQLRKDIMAEFNLSELDSFMQSFLAPAPYVRETDNDSYSCAFKSVTRAPTLTDVDDDMYSYFSEVSAVAGGPGGSSTTMHLIFIFSVDGEGQIHNLEAFKGV